MSQAEAVEVLSRMDRTAPAWIALTVLMRAELQSAMDELVGPMDSEERHYSAGKMVGVTTCMAAIGVENGVNPRRGA